MTEESSFWAGSTNMNKILILTSYAKFELWETMKLQLQKFLAAVTQSK